MLNRSLREINLSITRLFITLLTWSLLVSQASAMGLGDLRSVSYLGQPLKASIAITNDDPRYGLEDVKVRQLGIVEASALGIDLAGRTEPYRLKAVNRNGRMLIEIKSLQPVYEPFLNLLVELKWPTGTVYREYTVLIDPPPAVEPVQTSDRAPVSRPPQTNASAAIPTASRYTQRTIRGRADTPAMAAADGEGYRVKNGDSLSKIAAQLARGTQYTRSEMMRWLLANNPQAFIAGDMNRILAGKVLTLPSGSNDISPPPTAKQQTTDVAPAASADRPKRGEVEQPSASQLNLQQAEKDRLTIVTPSSAVASLVDGKIQGDNSVESLQARVAMTSEMVEQLRRENEAMAKRLRDIESSGYMDSLERLVLLKDEEISLLKQQLALNNENKSQLAELEPLPAPPEPAEESTESSTENKGEEIQAKETTLVEEITADMLVGSARWWWLLGLMLFALIGAIFFFLRWKSRERKVDPNPEQSKEDDEDLLLQLDDIIARQSEFETYGDKSESDSSQEEADPSPSLSNEPDFTALDPLPQPDHQRVRRPDDVVKQSIQDKTSNYVPAAIDEHDKPYHDELDILISEAIDAAKRGAYDVAEALLIAERSHQAHMTLNDRRNADSRLDLALEFIYQLRDGG